MDIDKVVPQLLGYMESMSELVAEGTVDEKRRFLRAFIRRVELDPKKRVGRVEL